MSTGEVSVVAIDDPFLMKFPGWVREKSDDGEYARCPKCGRLIKISKKSSSGVKYHQESCGKRKRSDPSKTGNKENQAEKARRSLSNKPEYRRVVEKQPFELSIRIQGRHTASNLAGELMNTITETGIGDRICSVTSDAASVNIKMMKLIEQEPGTIIHVLCVGHKLHLSVTNGLGLWSCKTIDGDETRSSQQTEDSSSDEDGDPDDILAEAESDSDAEDIDESSDLAWSRGVETTDDRRCRQWGVALLKARANGRLLRQSSVASSLLSECMRAEGIVRQQVCPRDINIRWNSTYRMVQWYVEYRPVFSLFQTRCQALPRSDNLHKHFRKFALTVPDFESLQNLASVLCHFEDATRLFSGSSYCTLSLIRPVVKGLLQKCSGAACTVQVGARSYAGSRIVCMRA
ncbi:hypothetical protein Pmar_PMAR029020 [Perkinsus marinus ATCC 50983]|uniref:DUF659 domain-containing protein n=1 Tax=Perkinsus marinus (strain ATCC 50983 / TXsc) TaxID=423536 RepID=C5L6A4_PERM5|nr:hypothetical protein Pmar_PMAR029020 [Perkinsus marinus ATCC 50983]EER07731.1 hypothetical protein Pmar_PMAR029020 [Perkinsus marinus ATCC 50983]|eukprot:XP_002775915.1 hypothetical protein Pmar_PMAR029020 [Perkinsus marinus ATCC 50983]